MPVLIVIVVFLVGCSGRDTVSFDIGNYGERSVASIYNEALDTMYSERYSAAAKIFEEVERQHPYSWWARKAQLMAAFCYYRINEYQDAILTADRFIRLHPGHRYAPYAYYLKGISYYEQIKDVARDQRDTELALDTFRRLVERHPDSVYARVAVQEKIDVLIDNLAGKEMEIGRFYQRRGNYIGALNRFNKVVRDYENTIHVVEALHRLVENYLSLGLVMEARRTAAVLGYNYPKSEWYRDSYSLLADYGLVDNKKDYRRAAISLSDIGDSLSLKEQGGGRDALVKSWQQLLSDEDNGFRQNLEEKKALTNSY